MEKVGAPIVVKADGLAAGKGVMVCQTKAEARAAIELIMFDKAFGEAGHKLLLEECLTGEEASFLVFTDGRTVLPMPTSQDHKPIYDNDQGPNTGGMGAYSPAPVVDPALFQEAMNRVMIPTVRAMAKEGRLYKGVLYAGLMIKDGRIKVLEFNVRFGDPEAQPLLMRLKTDLVEIFEAVANGTLHKIKIDWDERPAVCVVMAEKGYPGSYQKGHIIEGLDQVKRMKDVVAFHAGTALKDKAVVTNGGRVLGVTALGEDIPKAIKKAYQAVGKIGWETDYCRTDIGRKALKYAGSKAKSAPMVGIVMGSDSDLPIMEGTTKILREFNIPYELMVSSAHRSPKKTAEFARKAGERGFKVLIAGAGAAAHLAGVLAAETTLPVIGVPIDSSSLKGLDSLLAMVQMPSGIPVATMAVGPAGAKNAAILAAQILALNSPSLASALKDFKTASGKRGLGKRQENTYDLAVKNGAREASEARGKKMSQNISKKLTPSFLIKNKGFSFCLKPQAFRLFPSVLSLAPHALRFTLTPILYENHRRLPRPFGLQPGHQQRDAFADHGPLGRSERDSSAGHR